jgi:hypothetical protein
MLVFLDESYETDGAGKFNHAYAGFGVDEWQYRGLVAAVFQAKHRYFLRDTGFDDEQRREARKTHIVTSEAPERAEMKATKLLTAKQAEHYAQFGNAPGIEIALELLKALDQSQSTVFGILSNPADVADIQNPTLHLPLQFIRILERIEMWMKEQHPDQMAIVVPDTIHEGININLSEKIGDFLYRSGSGQKLRHIVVNPFWVDSRTTAGSQLADLIAHVLMNSMRPAKTRKRLDELWRKVMALEFKGADLQTRGIRRIRG